MTTFGKYVEPEEGDIIGRMSLAFQSGDLDIDKLWESSSLSAKFLSTFWGNFFPVQDEISEVAKKEVADSVHYICAELLGNAVKFSCEPKYMIEIYLYLHKNELRFYVINTITLIEEKKLQSFILKILNGNPHELFIEQLEKNIDEQSDESGIGYLTLIKDYGVDLSWKFQNLKLGINNVTVLARMAITINNRRQICK